MIANRVHTSKKKNYISFFHFFLSLYLPLYFLSFVIQLRTIQKKNCIHPCLKLWYGFTFFWASVFGFYGVPVIVFLAIIMFYWEIRIYYCGNGIWFQVLILYWAFNTHLCIFRVIFCFQNKVTLLTLQRMKMAM